MADSKRARLRTQCLAGWLQPFSAMRPVSRRMSLALFLWGMGEGMWMYIRPLYITELGGNPVQVGQVLAVAGLAPLLLMLPAGRLIDRSGPRLLMVLTWWLGTLAAVLLALAGSWQWLIPGFFLYAMSSASIPAINAYVAQEVQQRETHNGTRDIQAVLSLVFAAYFAGTIVSPVIGGWIGEAFGLRYVFWVSAGWFFLSTLAMLSTPALPSLTQQSDTPTPAASGAPWWRFSRAQLRIYVTLLGVYFLFSLGYTLAPTYLEEVRLMPVGLIGGLGAAIALGGVVWMLLLGGRHSRTGLIIGSGMMVVAFAGLLWGPDGPLQFPAMVGVYLMLGAYLIVRTLSLGVVSEYSPPEHRGTNYGIVETLFGAGVFLGPWAAGLLYDVSPSLPFLLAAGGLLPLMGVLWWALRPAEA